MAWQKTYLGQLWRQRRRLFWLVLVLMAGHLLPVFLNFQFLTPFYFWGMYTMPATASETYPVFHIRCNEGKVIARAHTYRDLGRMMWIYTLPKYEAYLSTGDTLPVQTVSARLFSSLLSGLPHSQPIQVTHAQVQAYPAWLRRYLEQETGLPVYRLNVQQLSLKYGTDGRPYAVDSQILIQYP